MRQSCIPTLGLFILRARGMQSIEIDKQPAVLTRPAGLVRSVYSVQCVLQYVHTVYSILYVEEVLSPRPITIMMIVCSVLRTASPLPFILYKLTRGPFRTESRDHHRRTACRSDPGVCISLLFVLVTVPADFNVQYLVINSGPSRKASWWCADISWYVMIVYCILVILVNHGLLAVMHSQLLYTYQLMILYTDYIQYYVLSLHYISVVQEMIWSRSPWRPTASTNKNPPGGPRVASFNPTDACPSGLPFERHSPSGGTLCLRGHELRDPESLSDGVVHCHLPSPISPFTSTHKLRRDSSQLLASGNSSAVVLLVGWAAIDTRTISLPGLRPWDPRPHCHWDSCVMGVVVTVFYIY